MIKIQPTASLNTNLYLDAAKELDLKYEIINHELTLARIYNHKKELFVKGCVISANHSVGNNIARDKYSTSTLLNDAGLPVPQFRLFSKIEDAYIYANQQTKPIVVKPTKQSTAKGVYIKPRTPAEKKVSIDEAFSFGPEILIEDYIVGKDYRITVFDNKVIAVSERIPAYVIGNGKLTVKELIDAKNAERLNAGFPLIIMEEKDIRFIQTKGVCLSDIPSCGIVIRLKLACNMAKGGESKRIPIGDIPIKNIELFKQAAQIALLRFCGVDFITPDIRKPYTEIGGTINELNSAPMQEVHYFDQLPFENYSTKIILKSYFELN